MNNQNAPYGRINTVYDTPENGSGNGPSFSTPMPKDTKKEILKVSGILGAAIIVFYLLGEGIGRLVVSLVNTGIIEYNFTEQQILQILYTFITILLPFALAAFFIRKVQHREPGELLPLDKPKSGILFIEALGIGCLAIVVANVGTAILVHMFEVNGIEFDSYKPDSPTNTYQFLWMLLSNAIVPALVEEYALRGVLLQSMRKYGDAFAVVSSALVFAMMHGNMTQAPFAFILGVVLAILVILTRSLWTSIAIHLINNTYSVAMTTLYDKGNDLMTSMVTVSLYTLAGIYGCIALVYLVGLHRNKFDLPKRYQPGGPSKEGIRTYRLQAWLYTVISPTMLVALVILIAQLAETVHRTG